jgi:hypothetical protein
MILPLVSVRGKVMPIRQFLSTGDVLQPDDLTIMNAAFSAALTKLGLADRQDPLVEIVGRRIVDAVLDGERDLIRLTEIGAGGREQHS